MKPRRGIAPLSAIPRGSRPRLLSDRGWSGPARRAQPCHVPPGLPDDTRTTRTGDLAVTSRRPTGTFVGGSHRAGPPVGDPGPPVGRGGRRQIWSTFDRPGQQAGLGPGGGTEAYGLPWSLPVTGELHHHRVVRGRSGAARGLPVRTDPVAIPDLHGDTPGGQVLAAMGVTAAEGKSSSIVEEDAFPPAHCATSSPRRAATGASAPGPAALPRAPTGPRKAPDPPPETPHPGLSRGAQVRARRAHFHTGGATRWPAMAVGGGSKELQRDSRREMGINGKSLASGVLEAREKNPGPASCLRLRLISRTGIPAGIPVGVRRTGVRFYTLFP
jgi:hypothetical protein